MIPDAIGLFRSGSFAGMSWGLFATLIGVLPLVVILATRSSVTKRRRECGGGAAAVCLVLLLGAMAFLLLPARSRRHVHIEPPPVSSAPSVNVEVPAPDLTPGIAIAGAKSRHADAALDDRGPLSVSVDVGHGTNIVSWTGSSKRRLSCLLERFSPKLVWSVITACAIGALMFVGYIALDAGTRGHFTWPLRVLSVLCLGAIVTTVVALRHAL